MCQSSHLKSPLIFAALTLLAGCGGPLTVPMVQRLEPDEQLQIDKAWNNVLTPVDRIDRQTLLDMLVCFQAYQRGVDKLTLHSEKAWAGGTVTMDIHFDRLNPRVDRCDLSVFDAGCNLLRRESYRPSEIEQTVQDLFTPIQQPDVTQPDFAARWIQVLERERRHRALIAATQPAGGATPPAGGGE